MKRSLRAAAAAALTTLPLLACDHSATAPRLDQLTLDVVSGDGQTAVVGTQVGPLIVKVTSSGNPVPLQVLNFRVVAGGGSVYGGTELTDNDGIAQELWTLGTKASDVQKVEVRAVESSTGAEKVFATFTATALADKAAKLIAATGDNQAGLAGSAVTVAPAAEATDQYGNPIANVAVLFAVATGGGRATGLSQTTNTSGVATVGSWTLGTAAGTNTLTAGTPGLTLAGSPVTFTVVGTTGTAAQLVLVSGNNQSASPGTKLPQSATVQVVDANGNGVANVAVTFTVTSGGGSIDGVGSVTTLTSMGTSSMPPGSAAVNWTLGSAAGTNTLQATAVGLNGSPLGFTATAVSAKPLYVSNGGNNSITVYAAGANGNAAPTMTIAGSNTGLSGPQGIARDGAGNIYVANFNNSTITVYATGASGNATPTATIAGSNTGLNFVHGIALDVAGNIYVANQNSSTITVYAAGASGDATPTATIAGSNTGLNQPVGIALDGTGNIYVANVNSSTITVYAAGASGNATPIATIAGSNTGLNGPVGIALDGAANVYVTNVNNSTITVYAPGANGNPTPTATIAGANTGLQISFGIALDAAGKIYVANQYNDGSITVYAPGANGNVTPTAKIQGGNTGLSSPELITF